MGDFSAPLFIQIAMIKKVLEHYQSFELYKFGNGFGSFNPHSSINNLMLQHHQLRVFDGK